MPENNSILEKLEGLESRYEEVGTLITDPSVISDQERYVRLTREYKDLDEIMKARKRYIACLNSISEAKDILANESDPDLKEMAREELQANEELQPKIEEEIKIALIPKDPEDAKMYKWRYEQEQAVTKPLYLPEIYSKCTRNFANLKGGHFQ